MLLDVEADILADSEALGLWLAEMLLEALAEIDADSEALGD